MSKEMCKKCNVDMLWCMYPGRGRGRRRCSRRRARRTRRPRRQSPTYSRCRRGDVRTHTHTYTHMYTHPHTSLARRYTSVLLIIRSRILYIIFCFCILYYHGKVTFSRRMPHYSKVYSIGQHDSSRAAAVQVGMTHQRGRPIFQKGVFFKP